MNIFSLLASGSKEMEKKHGLLQGIKKHGADADFILSMLDNMRKAKESQSHLIWLKHMIDRERELQKIKRVY